MIRHTLSPTAMLFHADCRDALRTMADCSVDAVVTDPPYELNFMGKGWDNTGIANDPALWAEVFRVLKPGGHCAAFSASRTYHRMACAIEDAGFEIRDSLMWVYGTGFPKSQDVSKFIDKMAGAEREVVATIKKTPSAGGANTNEGWVRPWAEGKTTMDITAPATDAAQEWQGWGTALKPAFEPIVLARKPLSEGTVAANVLRWRTGALNIDGCRVPGQAQPFHNGSAKHSNSLGGGTEASHYRGEWTPTKDGRWPANVVHDGSDEVVGAFPDSKGGGAPHARNAAKGAGILGAFAGNDAERLGHAADSGSAARFFYSAKASKADRAGSKHPTVKPISLMEWLCTLITPPGGTILDPFGGSGTTAIAASNKGFPVILCEREAEYVTDIQGRFGPVGPVLPAAPAGGR